MVAAVQTLTFEGIEVKAVRAEVQISSGLPAFTIVGLPDKAVTEARERVRGALSAIGLALPPERITVNLSPADLPKEGSHFDLPIALALLQAIGALPEDSCDSALVMGELGLDGSIRPVNGTLPAAMAAVGQDLAFICPQANGSEAAWSGHDGVLAAPGLLSLINHLTGQQQLPKPDPPMLRDEAALPDLTDVKGQAAARRALEVAAAGGHNLLMIGPPGSGKSMLAARLPGILPPLSKREALEASLVASVAGHLDDGQIRMRRPFRDPHHSASLPALVGGGAKAKPGEVSLAHGGVLFLDELPEFNRSTLEALRQPLETGSALVSRAAAHVRYPARFQLVAAMNPCRCGYLGDEQLACSRAPKCALDYQAKISGPLYDRIDITVEVPALGAAELSTPRTGESSKTVGARVMAARQRQRQRYDRLQPGGKISLNAEADGVLLDKVAALSPAAKRRLDQAIPSLKLSARGYHRVLRVARTIADLAGEEVISELHLAEAVGWRRIAPQSSRA